MLPLGRARPFPGLLLALFLGFVALAPAAPAGAAPIDYRADVAPILLERCAGCHNAEESKGDLSLESHETLLRGGKHGVVVVPHDPDGSLLVRLVERREKPFMPPGKRPPLEARDVAVLRAWIAEGAKAPADPGSRSLPVVPRVEPRAAFPLPVRAVAWAPAKGLLAVARGAAVEVRGEDGGLRRRLAGQLRAVNAVAFSADGARLLAGGGLAGHAGEVRLHDASSGSLLLDLEGPRDSIYAVAVSPDGTLLAASGYDARVYLWRVDTGEKVATFKAHEGAIFALGFRGDGRVLATASADRTVKLWDTATRERLETLGQSTRELNAVAFRPDGAQLASAGLDNRLRLYDVSPEAREGTNPLRLFPFGHERAVLALAYSRDGKLLASSSEDRTVKLWDALDLSLVRAISDVPEDPVALTFAGKDDALLAVGGLDGSLRLYETATGRLRPPPKPALSRLSPPGVQRGGVARARVLGSFLDGVTAIATSAPGARVSLAKGMAEGAGGSLEVEVTSAADAPPGRYEVWAESPGGRSNSIPIEVDTIPQTVEVDGSDSAGPQRVETPVAFWGTIDAPGDTDRFTFNARAGEALVIDAAASRWGSPADLVLTVLGPDGGLVASSSGFDGETDPFLVLEPRVDGLYTLEAREEALGGSSEHIYRIAVGAFPFVTATFPLSLPAGREGRVRLLGPHVPDDAAVLVTPPAGGEVAVPIEAAVYRSRRTFRAVAGEGPESIEVERNDTAAEAMAIDLPCSVGGRLDARADGSADADCFAFEAAQGEVWIFETEAARRGSPADTRLELLHEDGTPVARLLLQGLRDTQVTFRGIDSVGGGCRLTNWQEMHLNQYLYLEGEVVRLYRMPQGPDSDSLFYPSETGARRTYFETTAAAHALETLAYIVEPLEPDAAVVPNGLPVFTIPFSNDDGERRMGRDSRVTFRPPRSGRYVARVTDVAGSSSERHVYRLLARRPKPDYRVTLDGLGSAVSAGSGQEITARVERLDGFDGEVRVDLEDVPAGFVVTRPLVIEVGHLEAKGTLFALTGAVSMPEGTALKATASAVVDGKAVAREVAGLGRLQVGGEAPLAVALLPAPASAGGLRPATAPAPQDAPLEIELAPGGATTALIRIARKGHDDRVTFSLSGLPHGVIVDNIGLNGVLIPRGETERTIFLVAESWVPETSRLAHAVSNEAGRQTSLPILLHVRRSASGASAPPLPASSASGAR